MCLYSGSILSNKLAYLSPHPAYNLQLIQAKLGNNLNFIVGQLNAVQCLSKNAEKIELKSCKETSQYVSIPFKNKKNSPVCFQVSLIVALSKQAIICSSFFFYPTMKKDRKNNRKPQCKKWKANYCPVFIEK